MIASCSTGERYCEMLLVRNTGYEHKAAHELFLLDLARGAVSSQNCTLITAASIKSQQVSS